MSSTYWVNSTTDPDNIITPNINNLADVIVKKITVTDILPIGTESAEDAWYLDESNNLITPFNVIVNNLVNIVGSITPSETSTTFWYYDSSDSTTIFTNKSHSACDSISN